MAMKTIPAVLLSLALAGSAAGAQMIHGGGHASGGAGFGGHSFGSTVSRSGQFARPGQFVTSPGQTVFTPGRSVFGPGQTVSPAPNVLTPFNNGLRGPYAGGWNHGYGRPDANHDRGGDRDRGRGVPFLFGGGYWLSPYDLGYPDFSGYNDSSDYNGQPQGETVQGQPGAYPQPGPDQQSEMASSQYRPDYGQQPAAAPNVIQQQEPSLTVVMKDGSKEQIRNYAVTRATLIDLDDASTGHLKRIPLDEVNVSATESAAQQAGLSFTVPTS